VSLAPRYDLLIVGGGPAGSMLALLAARAGLRVRLFDHALFPRPKACGGVLCPRAVGLVDEAGLAARLTAAGAEPIRSIHVYGPDGRRTVLPYGEGLALERERLDVCLLEAAAGAGAEICAGARVEDLRLDAGRWPARLRYRTRDGRGGEALGAWVAGAGGAHCPVRRRLAGAGGERGRMKPPAAGRARSTHRWSLARANARQPRAGSAVAVSAVLEGCVAPAGVCEMHLLGGGYCGVSAAGGGRTTVGMVLPAAAWRRLGAPPSASLALALAAHPSLAGRMEPLRLAAGPWASGPLRTRAPQEAAPGVVLLGDALARMEPITGEGMAEALSAARRVARWLVRSADPRTAPDLHRWLAAQIRPARRRAALAAALSRAPRTSRLALACARHLPPLARIAGERIAGRRWAHAGGHAPGRWQQKETPL
jgi:flavin-dependent dehydrogenase